MGEYNISQLSNDKDYFEQFLDETRTQSLKNKWGDWTLEEAMTPVMGACHNTGENIKRGFNDIQLKELLRQPEAPVELLNEGLDSCIGDTKEPIQSSAVIDELNNYLYRQGVYSDYEYAKARGLKTISEEGQAYLKEGKTQEELDEYNQRYYDDLWETLHQDPQEIKEEAHIRKNSASQAYYESQGRRVYDGFSKDNPRVKSSRFYNPIEEGEEFQTKLIEQFPGGRETIENLGYKAKLQAFNNLSKGLYGSASHYFRDEYEASRDALKGQLNELTVVGVKGVDIKSLQSETTKINGYDGGVDIVGQDGRVHQVKTMNNSYNRPWVSNLKQLEVGNLKRKYPNSLIHFVGLNEQDKVGGRARLSMASARTQNLELPPGRGFTVEVEDLGVTFYSEKQIKEKMEENAKLAQEKEKEDKKIGQAKSSLMDKIKGYKNQEKDYEIVF